MVLGIAYLESSYSSVPVKCSQVEQALTALEREEKRTIKSNNLGNKCNLSVCNSRYARERPSHYHFVAKFCSHNGKLPVITFNGSMVEKGKEKLTQRGMYYSIIIN